MSKNPLDQANVGSDKSICKEFAKGGRNFVIQHFMFNRIIKKQLQNQLYFIHIRNIFQNLLIEKVLLSTLVQKQERILCITDKAVYNILPPKFLQNLLQRVVSVRIKRIIPLKKIFGVTVSRFGDQFVIHVPNEHDYLLQSEQFRDKIIEVLCFAFYNNTSNKMAFFYRDDMVLMPYCTTITDAKNKRSHLPKDEPQYLDPESMVDNKNAKGQSDLVFTRNNQNPKLSINDFHLIKVLGRGAFGKVMLCQKKDTNELYAIKSIRKEEIIEQDQIEHTINERKILEQINFKFLVNLEYAFQTQEKIFFAMKFVRGGELFSHLKKDKKFKEPRALFYAAQILLALEYLHNLDIVYRDLKPENILIDQDGYVKLTDFGLAKYLEKGQLTHSKVGTPDYLSPEIIDQIGHNKTADYWALGILIYEMVIGIPPFFNNNQKVMFQNITEKELRFPQSSQISKECTDLLLKLLNKNPNERLGSTHGAEEIKEHPWFKQIDFNDLLNKNIPAPFVPQLKDETDVSHFDEEFTSEVPVDSFVQPSKLKSYESQFTGMSFAPGMQSLKNNSIS